MTYETREFLEQYLLRENYFTTFDEMVVKDKNIPNYVDMCTNGKVKLSTVESIDLFEMIGDAFENYKELWDEKQ